MIRTLHIVAIAFALLMLALTYRNYLKQRRFGALVFWNVIWLGTIITILLFDRLKVYTEAINVRVFDFLVVIAFLAAFGMLFTLYGKLQQLGSKMEEIVQAIAMRDAARAASRSSATVARKRRGRHG